MNRQQQQQQQQQHEVQQGTKQRQRQPRFVATIIVVVVQFHVLLLLLLLLLSFPTVSSFRTLSLLSKTQGTTAIMKSFFLQPHHYHQQQQQHYVSQRSAWYRGSPVSSSPTTTSSHSRIALTSLYFRRSTIIYDPFDFRTIPTTSDDVVTIPKGPSRTSLFLSNNKNSNNNGAIEKEGTTTTGTNPNNNNDTTTTTSATVVQHEFNWERITKQVQLFIEMSGPYYKESTMAKWLLAGVIGLTIANSGISVLFSYTGKDFWNALSEKNVDEFYHVLGKYIIALAIGAPVTTLYKYQREQLAVHWREWMTTRTLELYTNNQVYYKLERLVLPTQQGTNNNDDTTNGVETTISVKTETIDNPDQRITEDVKTFTSFSLQLLITLLTSIIDLVSFSFILWSIYPQLFLAVIGYATIGTVITAVLGKSLVTFNFIQLRREADLRYLLVRVRDNAESIAFYAGEELEKRGIDQRIHDVMTNKRSLNTVQRNLEFFTNSYRYFIQILPVAVVAPQYFAGQIALGVISQSAGAFNHILSDLSILINQFEQLSAFSAGIERLSDFYQAMKYADPQRATSNIPLLQPYNATLATTAVTIAPIIDVSTTATTIPNNYDNYTTTSAYYVPLSVGPDNTTRVTGQRKYDSYSTSTVNGNYNNGIQQHQQQKIQLHRWEPLRQKVSSDTTILKINQMDLYTPDRKRTLIKNLSISLQAGENLLIVGNSGAGKSSLLRAIAGLWNTGTGRIERPADDDVYFLPQRPYCTIGSLKDQLLYPSIESTLIATNTTTTTTNSTTVTSKQVDDADIPNQSRHHHHHMLKHKLSDDELLDVLQQVELLDIAIRSGDGDPYRGLYAVQDWSNQLSLGEQQRLAFGRLLVNQPSLVILDEATSALDIVNEARMYMLLKNLAQKTRDGNTISGPGLTYVSVGHRPSLVNFHDTKLRLAGDGTDHEMISLRDEQRQQQSSSSSSISTTLFQSLPTTVEEFSNL